MLLDEITETDDYGYFIDIDNGTVLTHIIMERSEHYYVEKSKPVTLNYKELTKTSLFYLNTICCIGVSILFFKVWIFTSKY